MKFVHVENIDNVYVTCGNKCNLNHRLCNLFISVVYIIVTANT